MIRASRVTPLVFGTASATKKSTAGRVFWILVSVPSGSNMTSFRLIDGGPAGTVKVNIPNAADTLKLYSFDPPLEFATDIFYSQTGGDNSSEIKTLGYQ